MEKLFPLALSEVLLSSLNKDDFTEEGILQIIAEPKTQTTQATALKTHQELPVYPPYINTRSSEAVANTHYFTK